MQEIELKILNIDKADITRRLLALGAQQKPTILVVSKAFDFKDKNIGRHQQLIRLRKVGDTAELTHKVPVRTKGRFKVMEETEVGVADFATMEKILTRIGLRCIRHHEKHRTSFALGKTKFEIDEYPRIPPYIEIEGTPEEITKYVQLLGYTMDQTTSLAAQHVLKRYKVDYKHLVF